MSWAKTIAGSAVMAALIATSVTPAMARRGHGGWHHRHHDRDDIDAGDVLAGILILGGIAAVASAASKNKRSAPEAPAPYPQSEPDSGSDFEAQPSGITSEDAAVDACAAAAEQRAADDGRNANVREIGQVGEADGGWDVEGVVETRQGYRDTYPQTRRFTCTVRFGQVEDVVFGSDIAFR